MKRKGTSQKPGPAIHHQEYVHGGIISLTDAPGLEAQERVRTMWANLPIEERPSEREPCILGSKSGKVQTAAMLNGDSFAMIGPVTVRFRPLPDVGLLEATSWLSGKLLRSELVPSKESNG